MDIKDEQIKDRFNENQEEQYIEVKEIFYRIV